MNGREIKHWQFHLKQIGEIVLFYIHTLNTFETSSLHMLNII